MPEDVGAPEGPPHLPAAALRRESALRRRPRRLRGRRDLAQARDAAELVEVDYEPLPGGGRARGRRQGWRAEGVGRQSGRQRRASGSMFGNKDATDAAFAKAKHVVSLRVENNRLSPCAMEPRVAIGDYSAADDQYTLYADLAEPAWRCAWRCRTSSTCRRTSIRVVSPDVGGGFGLKGGAYPEDALVLWASRKLGRPVKWIATALGEHADRPSRPREGLCTASLRSTSTARFSALRARMLFQIGAYFVGAAFAAGAFSIRLHSGSLRHPGDAAHVAGRVHQHVAMRTLSRRRAPGGRLFHRAPDRARGARDRHGPGRDQAAQSHSAATSCPTPRRPCSTTTAASLRG